MRTLMLASLCLVASAICPASAEDFTGFYAGANAGYAFETRDGSERGPGATGLGRPDSSEAGFNALPPSAQDAARALQARNRASGAGSGFPR